MKLININKTLIIFYIGIASISVFSSRFVLATIVDSASLSSTGAITLESQNFILKSKKDIPRALWLAKSALKAGQFENVITITKQIIDKEAENIEALAFMTVAYYALNDETHYLQGVKQLNLLAPESATLHLALATLYQQQGHIDKASNLYKKILQKRALDDQSFLNASFALCQIDLNNKAYEQVIQRATIIIQAYPPLPQGYKFLAIAYNQQAKPEQSLKTYKRLLEVNPNIPLPYQELALLYVDQFKDLEQAIQYAKLAVQKFPKDPKSHDVLGWVYYNQQKFTAALRHFSKAIQQNASMPDYFYHTGLANQKMGNNSDAQSAFQHSLLLSKGKASPAFVNELKKRIQQTR
ncbi:tetratricopeptide repeat protein [sulfur-oxidizing endosymbiont of Gigantopelta aegis]|uniref:tetratricopeptide repeat protein n=1 Tax=sulfur-oxidizing endosymbiont of Gigantopelta aegis TaxID=2794934 RepID=UPI0018DD5E21|nr:tetratricopeptide repeat protein [sulfur-oxidizing endosymbiont of Gigantopelta aegis]